MKINKENWKGKEYAVVRNNKGNIVSRRRITKDFKLHNAKEKFKNDNTLKEGIKLSVIGKSTVSERFDYSNQKNFLKQKSKQKFQSFQVYSKVIIKSQPKGIVRFKSKNKNQVVLYGISSKHTELETAINESRENLYNRVAQFFGEGYDAEVGEQISELQGSKIKYQIQYFRKRGESI